MSTVKKNLKELYRDRLLTVTNEDGSEKENPLIVKNSNFAYKGTTDSVDSRLRIHNTSGITIDPSMKDHITEVDIGANIEPTKISFLKSPADVPVNLKRYTYRGSNEKVQIELDRLFWDKSTLSNSLEYVSLPECESLRGGRWNSEKNRYESIFYSYSKLKAIDIPKATSLGYHAFKSCASLTSIDLKNVTSLGDWVFDGCASLSSIGSLNDKLSSLGYWVFNRCTSLISVDLKNVTSLGDYVFYNCTSLSSIGSLNDRLSSLVNNVFQGCTSLSSIDLKNVTSLEDYVFQGCTSLSSIGSLNDKLSSLGEGVFDGCASLPSIDLKNITSLGSQAFCDCTSLPSIDLKNITSLGDYVFYGCTSLSSIDLKNITSLGKGVFQSCTSLSSIGSLNDGLTSLGKGVFCDCTSLPSIDLKNITSLGDYVFYGCTSLSSIGSLNDELSSLGEGVFRDCTSLSSIDLKNITSLGDYVFESCTSLSSIDLKNITSLGDYVFWNCNSLKTIYCGLSSDLDWDSKVTCPNIIGVDAFSYIDKNWVMIVPPKAYEAIKADLNHVLHQWIDENWTIGDPFGKDAGKPNQHVITIKNNPLEPLKPKLTVSTIDNEVKTLNNNTSFSYSASNKINRHEVSYDNGKSWNLLDNGEITESRAAENMHSYICKLNNAPCGIFDIKFKLTDEFNQIIETSAKHISILNAADAVDKFIFNNKNLNGLEKTPPSLNSSSPLKMYGRVNTWYKNKNTLAQELITCYTNRVHGYHIEYGGWGKTSIWTDAAWNDSPNSNKTLAENTFKWLIDKCRKLGLWLFVSVANDNMDKDKHGNRGYETNLSDIQARVISIIDDIKSFGSSNLLIQPIAETKTPAGTNIETYCKNNLKQQDGWLLVNNHGSRPNNNNGMTYRAMHPASINNINSSYNGVIMSSDHSDIIRQLLNLGNDITPDVSFSSRNTINNIKELYDQCKAAHCKVCCVYMFSSSKYDQAAIAKLGSLT